MTQQVKIVPIGDAYGVVIPQDILQRLGFQPGDTLALDEASDAIALRADTSEFDRQMAIGRNIIRRDRNILSALAK